MSEEFEQSESEVQARTMGWRPQEEFKGDPEKWVSAEEFVERGKSFIPLLKKDNKRLEGQVGELSGKVAELTEMLKESSTSIEALREFHAEDTKRRVRAAKAAVREEISRASEAGEHDRVAELTEQLTDLQFAEREANAAEKESKKQAAADTSTAAAGKKADEQKDYSKEPFFVEWQEDNSWYGKEVVKSAVADLVAQQLRAAGTKLTGREFLDAVSEATEAELERAGLKTTRRVDKVEGSAQHGGSSGSSVKGFGSLPADAKKACMDQEKKMVGQGKPFKDQKAWQKYFVEYYKED